ncbi:MAG: protein translocase subunit SecD [Micromonosporaceae bacterium]
MAPPQGQIPASRYLAVLFVIVAGLWGLVIYSGQYTPRLGLDLRGGTSLTLEATTSGGGAADRQKLEEARDIIANRVNDTGVAEAEVTIEGDRNIVVNVPGGAGDLKKVGEPAELRFRQVLEETPNVPDTPPASPTATPSGSAQPSGSASPKASGTPNLGASATPTAKPSGSASGAATPSPTPTDPSVEELKTSAYTKLGKGDPKKGQELLGQVAGITSEQLTKIAQDPRALEFLSGFRELTPEELAVLPAEAQFKSPTVTCEALNKRPAGSIKEIGTTAAACDEEGGTKYLLDKATVLGTDVDKADYTFDPNRGIWLVTLDFSGEGQKKWTKLTEAALQKKVAVVLDNEVVSAPTVEQRMTSDAEITGSFTRLQVQTLASQLEFGALPLTFTVQSQQQISPTLGLDQMQAGLLAGMIGVLLVVVYCFIYYRALGVVVISSLLASGAIVYASIVLLGKYWGFTLTLAGIAGFIVAIGITADSFVVFFERLKDEVKDGRSVRSAVPRAWVRARRTMVSANMVQIIASVVLYVLAIGAVRGFAFTIGLSAAIDLLILFIFTHPLVAILSKSRTFTSPRFSGLGNVRPDSTQPATRVRGRVRTKES